MTRVTSVASLTADIDDKLIASVKLQELTQTLIVEKVDQLTFLRMPGSIEDSLLKKGFIPENWVERDMPLVFNNDIHVLLVHSVDPYVPKRAREE